MTSHHDVAGATAHDRLIERLLDRPAHPPVTVREQKELESLRLIVESQAKTLSEAERTSCGDWASQRENDALTIEMYNWKARALAAERAYNAIRDEFDGRMVPSKSPEDK